MTVYDDVQPTSAELDEMALWPDPDEYDKAEAAKEDPRCNS